MKIKAAVLSLMFGILHLACVVRVTLAELDCKEHCAPALIAIGRVLDLPLSNLVRLYREAHQVHGHPVQWMTATVVANSVVWAVTLWFVLMWFGRKRQRRLSLNQ